MAVLMAPDYIDFGGSDEPKTLAIVVPATGIAHGGLPVIFNPNVLMFPDLTQLGNICAGQAV